jgi:hypothetical protein
MVMEGAEIANEKERLIQQRIFESEVLSSFARLIDLWPMLKHPGATSGVSLTQARQAV